jgi:DNA-binding Xre family transcriptional regulator
MASSRSLKLSTDGKRQVDRSLTDKAWRDANLAEAIGASEQTAEKFRLGRNVDRTYFVKFCQALGLDWEAVAESESPPAPNSGGAEPVEESRSTTTENLQQNSNEAQGIQVQGSETTIVGQTVNIYPVVAENLATVTNNACLAESEQFLIQVGRQSHKYWCAVEKPMSVYAIQPIPESCSQFFQVDISKFVDDVDPSFDITFVSNFDSLNIVYQFGLEIVSVANDWKCYGATQAAELIQQAEFEVEIPDIRSEIASEQLNGRFPRLLEPRKINRSLSICTNQKFILDSDRKVLNYEILLKKYMQNMPNYAAIRFWVGTQNKRFFSNLIHIFTI